MMTHLPSRDSVLGCPNRRPPRDAAGQHPDQEDTAVHATRRRLCAALVALGCAMGVAACGDDEEPTTTPTAAEQPADDLQPVKDFLLEHTERLSAEAAELREGAE